MILGVLTPRFAGTRLDATGPEPDPAQLSSITAERIAVVSVIGTLVSRSGYLDAASGLASYADIGEAIGEAMAAPNVRGVILDVDSSGGEVGGLFDLVEQIRAIKAGTEKPLWAVANEGALSAAYAIASTADRFYVTRTGEVGSIGVVAVHVDESGADAKAGLSWTFVFAGERKVDANGHEPLTGRARATIQADVDRLYAEFCALVAANRGISGEAARGTNAAIYRGELAVRAGLADRVGTLDFAIAEMVAELDGAAAATRPIFNPTPKGSPSMATKETDQIREEPTAPQPAASPAPPTPEAPQAAPPVPIMETGSGAADKLRAEFAEIAAVAAQAGRLGVTVDAADAMRRGISADALRQSVLEALAARAEATSVIAAAPSTPIAGDSPIVRRARERAAAARA